MIADSFYKKIIIRFLKVENEWVVYSSNGFSPKTINPISAGVLENQDTLGAVSYTHLTLPTKRIV